MGPGQLNHRLRTVYLILCIGYLAWMAAMMLPEHRRQAIRLKLLWSCAQVTSRLARHTGRVSMRLELETGEQVYGMPLLLSLCRERAIHAYDRGRNTS